MDGTYQCQSGVNVAESGDGGGGDAYADYGKTYDATTSVSGVADAWNQPIAGNFNQIRQLKAKYKQLKVFISLGGWTWSRYFSAAVATPALRATLVRSCIDTYILGNLAMSGGFGGNGAASGTFDGIDVDWEYPGVQGIGYNIINPLDGARFTLLMQEFRAQLDALGGAHKLLTFTVGAGQDKLRQLDLPGMNAVADWTSLMSYDYFGGWTPNGPTDFQSNLYPDPASPNRQAGGDLSHYNTDDAVTYLLAHGITPSKLVLGVPFYGRGWTGVGAANNGLYQNASAAAPSENEAGMSDYRILVNVPGSVYTNSVAQAKYKFDGTTFWTYDDPAVMQTRVSYAKTKQLRGIFAWSLDGDTPTGDLVAAISAVAFVTDDTPPKANCIQICNMIQSIESVWGYDGIK